MGEQHALTVALNDRRIGKNPAARAFLKAGAQQEVAIAVTDMAGHARASECAQCLADAGTIRIIVIIAHPAFEQVAKDIERLGRARRTARNDWNCAMASGRLPSRCRSEANSVLTATAPGS